MVQKTKEKQWLNHNGEKVPTAYIGSFDKKKERVIGQIIKRAERISKELSELKDDMFAKGDELYLEMLKDANIEPDDRKGNYTITSFDKSVKLEVKLSSNIDFNDHIFLAQKKINEYLNEKTKGIDYELTQLINNAFTTSKGRLDSKRIMQLFTLKIDHKLWREAMELIKKSMEVNNSVRYAKISIRDAEGKYEAVPLNIASI